MNSYAESGKSTMAALSKKVRKSGRGKGERRDLGKWKEEEEEEMRAHKLGEIREGGKGEA